MKVICQEKDSVIVLLSYLRPPPRPARRSGATGHAPPVGRTPDTPAPRPPSHHLRPRPQRHAIARSGRPAASRGSASPLSRLRVVLHVLYLIFNEGYKT